MILTRESHWKIDYFIVKAINEGLIILEAYNCTAQGELELATSLSLWWLLSYKHHTLP